METTRSVNDYKILLSSIETEAGPQFIAEFREFEFCSGGGETVDEAIKEAKENLAIYIEELKAMGKPVPAPITDDDYKYSGKFTLRMSKSLHKKAALLAESEGVSLNSIIVEAVAEYIESAPTNKAVDKLLAALAQFTNVVVGTTAIVGAINVFQQKYDGWNFNRLEVPFLKVGGNKCVI